MAITALALPSLLSLLLAHKSKAQMVECDLTQGEFRIECKPGANCIFDQCSTFAHIEWSPNGPGPLGVRRNEDRFSPSTGYHVNDVGDTSRVGYIRGGGCRSFCNLNDPEGSLFRFSNNSCSAICDQDACDCLVDPTAATSWLDYSQSDTPLPNAMSCLVLLTLPDAKVYPPEDLVIYESSTQAPDYQLFRCVEEFATCEMLSLNASSDSIFQDQSDVFQVQLNVTAEAGTQFHYARDWQNCTSTMDGICYVRCDPRCSCHEINSTTGESRDCVVGPPSTRVPTMPPRTSDSAPIATRGKLPQGWLTSIVVVVPLAAPTSSNVQHSWRGLG